MLVERSSEYITEPWGFETKEWFLNVLLVVETELEPDALMDELLAIEAELGRVRHPEKEGYCDRTVDLDILYYGDKIILGVWPEETNIPQLPEAEQRAAARRFVDRFCQPGKPSVMGVEVKRRSTPAFLDEVYEYSRKKYLAE